MSKSSLLLLPNEIIHQIIKFLPVTSILRLSETNHYFRKLCQSDKLWKHLTHRRYRVRSNTPTPRRLQMAGEICWRDLYSAWHESSRMPISRHSGPSFRAFAKANQYGLCSWLTISSAEDCRLRNGALRAHLIVQPVSDSAIINVQELSIMLVNNNFVNMNQKASGVSLFIDSVVVHGDAVIRNDSAVLQPDAFAIIALSIKVRSAIVEVDALEQLAHISVPVNITNKSHILTAKFNDKEIWDSYDLLPGGWWVRR